MLIWVPVPPERVLARGNPTGHPVACWLPQRGVMYLVRETEIWVSARFGLAELLQYFVKPLTSVIACR